MSRRKVPKNPSLAQLPGAPGSTPGASPEATRPPPRLPSLEASASSGRSLTKKGDSANSSSTGSTTPQGLSANQSSTPPGGGSTGSLAPINPSYLSSGSSAGALNLASSGSGRGMDTSSTGPTLTRGRSGSGNSSNLPLSPAGSEVDYISQGLGLDTPKSTLGMRGFSRDDTSTSIGSAKSQTMAFAELPTPTPPRRGSSSATTPTSTTGLTTATTLTSPPVPPLTSPPGLCVTPPGVSLQPPNPLAGSSTLSADNMMMDSRVTSSERTMSNDGMSEMMQQFSAGDLSRFGALCHQGRTVSQTSQFSTGSVATNTSSGGRRRSAARRGAPSNLQPLNEKTLSGVAGSSPASMSGHRPSGSGNWSENSFAGVQGPSASSSSGVPNNTSTLQDIEAKLTTIFGRTKRNGSTQGGAPTAPAGSSTTAATPVSLGNTASSLNNSSFSNTTGDMGSTVNSIPTTPGCDSPLNPNPPSKKEEKEQRSRGSSTAAVWKSVLLAPEVLVPNPEQVFEMALGHRLPVGGCGHLFLVKEKSSDDKENGRMLVMKQIPLNSKVKLRRELTHLVKTHHAQRNQQTATMRSGGGSTDNVVSPTSPTTRHGAHPNVVVYLHHGPALPPNQSTNWQITMELMNLGCLQRVLNMFRLSPPKNLSSSSLKKSAHQEKKELKPAGSSSSSSSLSAVDRVLLARNVGYQMLLGLDYLHHCQNTIHRDVKPGNVLLDTEGRVKLCDFDTAKDTSSSLAKTECGSIAYIAPEVLKWECSRATETMEVASPKSTKSSSTTTSSSSGVVGGYTEKCDSWGLGMTLFSILSPDGVEGAYPNFHLFTALQDPGSLNIEYSSIEAIISEVVQKHQSGGVEEVNEGKGLLDATVTDAANHVIDLLKQLTIKNPEERYSTCQALCHPFFNGCRNGSDGLGVNTSETGWCKRYYAARLSSEEEGDEKTCRSDFDNIGEISTQEGEVDKTHHVMLQVQEGAVEGLRRWAESRGVGKID